MNMIKAAAVKLKTSPQQVASLKNLLENFVQALTDNSLRKNTPYVYGVYLTSSIQKSSTIDRLLKPLRHAFNINNNALSTTPKLKPSTPYFVTKLFNDIIFKTPDYVAEAKLGKTGFTSWWRYSAAVLGLGLFVGSSSVIASHFSHNMRQLAQVEADLNSYQQLSKQINSQDLQLKNVLPAISVLKQALVTLDHTQVPWFDHLRRQRLLDLNKASQEAYQNAINQYLLPIIDQQTAQHLQSLIKQGNYTPADLYATLKAYLLLTKQYQVKQVNLAEANKFLVNYFQQLNNADLSAYLNDIIKSNNKAKAVNTDLIKQARAELNKLPLLDRAFSLLLAEPMPEAKLLNTEKWHNIFVAYPNQAINSIFTKSGRDNIFIPKAKQILTMAEQGDWVLANQDLKEPPIDLNLAFVEFNKRYQTAYQTAWANWLQQFKLKPFADLAAVQNAITTLSQADSPLTMLWQEVQANQVHNQTLPSLKTLLNPLATMLKHINNSNNIDKSAFVFSEQRFLDDKDNALSNLVSSAQQLPAPLNNWLTQLANNTWQLLLAHSASYINMQWQSLIIPSYTANIAHRYPLEKETSADIKLKDFQQFFAPNGAMINFFNTYFSIFIDQSQPKWHWKTIDGQSLPIASDVLVQLRRAKFIEQMFFPNDKNNLAIHFQLKPVALMPIVKDMSLNFANQHLRFTQKDTGAKDLLWPGVTTSDSLKLSFANINGKQTQTELNGPWALFRLLDRGNLTTTQDPKRFQLTFDLNGSAAKLDLLADDAINAFIPNVVQGFACPKDIV